MKHSNTFSHIQTVLSKKDFYFKLSLPKCCHGCKSNAYKSRPLFEYPIIESVRNW